MFTHFNLSDNDLAELTCFRFAPNVGGFTVLSTKGLSSFVSQMGPFELLRYPVSYVLIAVLVGTALAQITYLNRALQRFDSREVIVSSSSVAQRDSLSLPSQI